MKKQLLLCIRRVFPLILVLMVMVLTIPFNSLLPRERWEKAELIKDRWNIRCDGKETVQKLPTIINNSKCEKVILKNTIYPKDAGQTILFYLVQSEVKIWINRKLVYDFSIPETKFGKYYPPSRYHIAKIPLIEEPAELEIEITPTYRPMAGELPAVYTGAKYEMILEIIKEEIPMALGSIILIVLGFGIIFYSIISEQANRQTKRRLSSLSILAVFIGVWCFMETPIKQFLFHNYILASHILEIAYFGVPLWLSRFFMTFEETRKSKLCQISSYFALFQFCFVQAAVIFGVQFVKLNGFMQMATGLTLIFSTWQALDAKKESELHMILKPLYVLCIGFALELMKFFLISRVGSGAIVIVAFIIFIIYYVYLTIRKVARDYLELEKENNVVNKALERTKVDLMLSQIKPHFLYNTLISIQTILKVDPSYADELLFDFTCYLRSAIDSIESDELISFQEEVNSIEAYLHIERMRLGELLEVEYDIRACDFDVVPLSIEPIVENAVKHGIGKDTEKLVIRISSGEDDKYYFVEIKDNGQGFDVEQLRNKANSIGLSNIEYRLKKQMHAELEIKSVIGKGTTVIVRIKK